MEAGEAHLVVWLTRWLVVVGGGESSIRVAGSSCCRVRVLVRYRRRWGPGLSAVVGADGVGSERAGGDVDAAAGGREARVSDGGRGVHVVYMYREHLREGEEEGSRQVIEGCRVARWSMAKSVVACRRVTVKRGWRFGV